MPVPTAEQIEARLVRVFEDSRERGQMTALISSMKDRQLERLFVQQDDQAFRASLEHLRGSASTDGSRSYKNVILNIVGDSVQPEVVISYGTASRSFLQRVLELQGCVGVEDPISKELVGFDNIQLQDNCLLRATRGIAPWLAQVSTVEGFVRSSVKAFEMDALEAMYEHMRLRHKKVEVLPVRELNATNGKKREVDGVVVADGCAGLLEAKQQLDDEAVVQLTSCLDFIKDNELVGPGIHLKNKQLSGFLAGRTLTSDPRKVNVLVQECQRRGYVILVSSGRSLGVGNSRVPSLRVSCAIPKRVCGACSCVRVVR